jgi:coniferyl-aldehyde dehydrogenase
MMPTAAAAAALEAEVLGSLELSEDALSRLYRAAPGTRRDLVVFPGDLSCEVTDELAEAVRADFGNRSRHETILAEVFSLLSEIKHLKKNLKGWMKPRSRAVALTFQPASAKVIYQPLGVVGVIAPWNYPFQLALGPAAAALAAGNRVMVKPSELTPRTAALVERVLTKAFGKDLVAVVQGGAEVGAAFSALPFDHLLFTGSTKLGRLVMKAAAENLTPVTLELGGKSPCIVHESFPVEKAAERIVYGKCFNAGQTCIAPDYLLVPKAMVQPLTDALQAAVKRSYPTLADNPDYTAVVNDRHYARLRGLLDDAQKRGAKVVECNPGGEALDPAAHKLAPTLLLDVDDDMAVMQEEIFGPLLPIVPYESLEQAIAYVNDRPRPLALYYFDYDGKRADEVLSKTTSGGACVNETIMHFAVEDLPFGGVGPSGMGAYHGPEGFETFSHKKAVFQQSRLNGAGLIAPPYGDRINKMLKMLVGG